MDSLVVVLENSSGFLLVPSRLELLLHVLLLQHQILSLETLQLLYSQFQWHTSAKMGPTRHAKNMFGGFSNGIHQNIQKARKLVKCANVLENYSIFELKLCQNLTSSQTKNGFPSSLDNSLESKWKNTWTELKGKMKLNGLAGKIVDFIIELD